MNRRVQRLFNVGVQRPASEFPERADACLCDNCGRDISKRRHPPRAHCGKKWLTGAAEWDHFDPWERRHRIGATLGLSVLSMTLSSLFATVVYFALKAIGLEAKVFALTIALLPGTLVIVHFALEVAASMWRTRIGFSQWKNRDTG
jgi:hypothetical protein